MSGKLSKKAVILSTIATATVVSAQPGFGFPPPAFNPPGGGFNGGFDPSFAANGLPAGPPELPFGNGFNNGAVNGGFNGGDWNTNNGNGNWGVDHDWDNNSGNDWRGTNTELRPLVASGVESGVDEFGGLRGTAAMLTAQSNEPLRLSTNPPVSTFVPNTNARMGDRPISMQPLTGGSTAPATAANTNTNTATPFNAPRAARTFANNARHVYHTYGQDRAAQRRAATFGVPNNGLGNTGVPSLPSANGVNGVNGFNGLPAQPLLFPGASVPTAPGFLPSEAGATAAGAGVGMGVVDAYGHAGYANGEYANEHGYDRGYEHGYEHGLGGYEGDVEGAWAARGEAWGEGGVEGPQGHFVDVRGEHRAEEWRGQGEWRAGNDPRTHAHGNSAGNSVSNGSGIGASDPRLTMPAPAAAATHATHATPTPTSTSTSASASAASLTQFDHGPNHTTSSDPRAVQSLRESNAHWRLHQLSQALVGAERKAADYEKLLAEAQAEVEKLRAQLKDAQAAAQKLGRVAEAAQPATDKESAAVGGTVSTPLPTPNPTSTANARGSGPVTGERTVHTASVRAGRPAFTTFHLPSDMRTARPVV